MENRLSIVNPYSEVEFKSIDVDGKKEYHVSGFVSAPIVDNGHLVPDRDYADLVPEQLQYKIVERGNKGFANRASLNHDFLTQGNFLPVASGKFEAKTHPKVGKVSAWVDTVLDQESPKFPEIKALGESGQIKGFSIEYALPFKHHFETIEGKKVRVFDEIKTFGYAIVGGKEDPMNPLATADGGFEYKMMMPAKCDECDSMMMTEEEMSDHKAKKHGPSEMKSSPVVNIKKLSEVKMETQTEVKTEASDMVPIKVLEELRSEIKALKDIQQPVLNAEPKFEKKSVPEGFEADLAEYKKVVFSKDEYGRSKYDIDAQWKAAGKVVSGLARYDPRIDRRATSIENRGAQILAVEGKAQQALAPKGFEFKTQLEADTNRTTSGSEYYLAAAEMADVFDPVIAAHFNDSTVLWSRLRKDTSERYGDTYGFIFNYTRNASTTFYDESATDNPAGGQQARRKAHIPFVWARKVVQVSGPAMASARSGIGDVWAEEVRRATIDLIKALNQALFDNSSPSDGMTRGGESMSLNWLIDDGATNATLYGLTRTSGNFTTLQGNITAQTGSPRPTLENFRTMWTTSVSNGANQSDLIFVGNYTQLQWVLTLLQTYQRTTPTSARIGFEGLPEIDGIPFFADADATAGFIYTIDARETFLAVQLGPTMEELARDGDYRRAQIKIYFNLVCKKPLHNYKMTGFATS